MCADGLDLQQKFYVKEATRDETVNRKFTSILQNVTTDRHSV